MSKLKINKSEFILELNKRIDEGKRIENLNEVTASNAGSFTFSTVDKLEREIKTYDSTNKEMLKQAFTGSVSENDYLKDYSKIVHINDGLEFIPIDSNPNYAAAEIIKNQVVVGNMIEYLEDLQKRLHFIEQAKNEKDVETKEEYVLLMISSNPEDQTTLNFPLEYREVTERIKQSKEGYKLRVEVRMAVRSRDIIQAINETSPDFIHFSGHGDKKSLVIQSNEGLTVDFDGDTLVAVLNSASKKLKLVVLSSCESEAVAKKVSDHVDFCIGMNDMIGDKDATIFAAQFYSSIAFGLSMTTAFKQGQTAIRIEGLAGFDIPCLFSNSTADPDTVILIKSGRS